MEVCYLVVLMLLPLHAATLGRVPVMVPVLEGQPFILNCSKKLSISWFCNNEKVVENANDTLIVPSAHLGHSCLWECRNKDSGTLDRYVVSVTAPARVLRIDVKPGMNVSNETVVDIICTGHGNRPFNWYWYLNGEQLTHVESGKLHEDMNAIKLRLKRNSTIRCDLKTFKSKASKAVKISVYNGVPLAPRHTTTPSPRPPITPSRIECLEYVGTSCKTFLPVGQLWTSSKTLSAEEREEREDAAEQLLKKVDVLRDKMLSVKNASCAFGLKALLCGRVFPACVRSRSGQNREGKLCREHCTAVERLFCGNDVFKKLYDELSKAVVSHIILRQFVPKLKFKPCSHLPQASPLHGEKEGIRSETTGPLCTKLQLERKPRHRVSLCYAGKGEDYRGNVSHFRSSKNDPLQPCAPWKSSARDLQRLGYSVEVFPDLVAAGRACRNPAGLQQWPFCLPDNPTKRDFVPCDIESCVEVINRNRENNHTDHVNFFGLVLSLTRFVVMLAVVSLVLVALLVFILYCWCCRQRLGNQHSRLQRSKHRSNGVNIDLPMGPSSVSASVASDFDISDAKSSLLTPNQDYHGKALAEFISPKLQKFEYPRGDIEDLKELGRGAFGEVFLVEAKPRPGSSGEGGEERVRMAMKVLKDDATPEMQIQFLREASLLADLSHDNIVMLMGISLIYKPFCMLMEYMCHGDLNSYLRRHDPNNTAMRVNIDQAAVAMQRLPSGYCNGHVGGGPSDAPRDVLDRLVLCNMAMEIAEGMIYLSHQNYVHRDLATRNCLLDIKKRVKIADFGLCRHIRRGEDFIDDDHGAMPVRWMPLEAILERRFNLDTDVWSFGVLLWELFSFALQPYFGKTHEEVIEFLQKGSVLDKPAAAPDGVYFLMLRCWSRQRRDRPSFAFLKRQLSELCRRWTTVEAANHVT